MQVSGIVNPPGNASAADNTQPIVLAGKAGELLVAELHGKYYTQAYRNTAYIGSTAGGGVVPPIYSTTSQTFGIWNPAGNSRNAALQTFDAGIVTAGTAVVSSFMLSQTASAGSAVATGGISVFTSATPITAVVGSQAQNTVRFTPSAATTLATTFLMSLNFSFFSTAELNNGVGCHYDFDEGVIVPPNVAVWAANNVASGLTFFQTLRWAEPPV